MDITQSLVDQAVLLEALADIIQESFDPDAIRSALAAMTNTEAGRAYMIAHPVII